MTTKLTHLVEVTSLHLTGTGSGATIDFKDKPETLGKNLTIEAWFRPNVLREGAQTVLAAYFEQKTPEEGKLMRPVYLWLEQGKPKYALSPDPSQARALDVVLEGSWVHVAMVVSSGKISLILHGENPPLHSVDTHAFGTGACTIHKIKLGHFDESGLGISTCNAHYAEVRLWKGARTEDELSTHRQRLLVGNEDGLVGYWTLDEGAGSIVYDNSTNGNDGLLRAGNWQRDSGLGMAIAGQPAAGHEARLVEAHWQAKVGRKQDEAKTLAADAEERREELKKIVSDYEKALLTPAEDVLKKRDELAQKKAKYVKDKLDHEDQINKRKEKNIRLKDLLVYTQTKLADSQAVIARECDHLLGLGDVSFELMMAPGYGGVGLQLPVLGEKTEPGRLSALRVRLRERRKDQAPEIQWATVPCLDGVTEVHALRMLAEAGFKARVIHQAVESQEDAGRVLQCLYDKTEKGGPGQAELNSVVTLVVGQHASLIAARR